MAGRERKIMNKQADVKKSLNSKSDIFSKEEEYKRLNNELEAKTANLVREAEEVLRDSNPIYTRPSYLDNINAEDFLRGLEDDAEASHDDYSVLPESSRSASAFQQVSSRPSSSRAPSAISKVNSSTTPKGRPPSATAAGSRKPASASRGKSKSSGSKRTSGADNVAVLGDDIFLTNNHFSLQNTFKDIEGRLDSGDLHIPDDDDVMPSAAAEMGAEAQIRFLKAKLRVMQEEVDKLGEECKRKDEENSTCKEKMKELEEEKNRLLRTNNSQQLQIEKNKKLGEDAKVKADTLETQLSSLKKELEQLKRSQKQHISNQSATEVRLNRALEEVEKYKAQLEKAKSSSKEVTETEKRRVEQLLAENKRLEKQKNELMTGFKKQLKLIDILKKQKMHIEAAKMLAFTEEEFVKALEWGN